MTIASEREKTMQIRSQSELYQTVDAVLRGVGLGNDSFVRQSFLELADDWSVGSVANERIVALLLLEGIDHVMQNCLLVGRHLEELRKLLERDNVSITIQAMLIEPSEED